MKKLFQVPDGILFFPADVTKDLKPLEVLVYAAMYTRYVKYKQRVQKDEDTFTSIFTSIIARQIGSSVPSVVKAIEKLGKEGLIIFEVTEYPKEFRVKVVDPDKERMEVWQKDS